MSILRYTFVVLASLGLIFAQQDLPERTFRTTVSEVVAPVTVMTPAGNYVNGLEERDFRLFDNGELQDIELSVTYTPISMVVAIQRNAQVERILPNIKKIGNMLEQLVIGEYGEAALVTFHSRVETIQDFTNDGAKFTEALNGLRAGASTSRMIDAVFYSINMLRRRPADQRRILVLISETRDKGSEARMRDALVEAEFHNVIIYTININRAIAMFTKTPPAPRPSSFPVASRPMPHSGVMAETPHNINQLRGDESMTFVPIIKEIMTQVKAIFVPNQAEVFTQYTGGREYSFVSLSSLERAVADLGEELHSQYILSYSPSTLDEGGYHEIKVQVNRPNLDVRTRPGYWMAARFEQE